MRSGTSYNNPKDSGTTRIVAITGVDAAARSATGMTRERTTITINCAFPVGGLIVTPAVGEQWYVQKVGFEYTLLQRLPANSKELQTEASEGQVQVGSSGPLTLHGSEVQVESNLKLGDTLYRDTSGTLENSTDKGATWTAIKGNGTGVGGVSSVSGRTGDVTLSPDDVGLGTLESRLLKKANLVSGIVPATELPSPRVFQYADEASFPAEGATNTIYISEDNTKIFIWDGTAYLSIVEEALAPLCNNDFIKALRGLGTGDTLIDKLATGLQTLVNQLWQALFCNFTGNLTPTILRDSLQGISTLLSNNPLITGLASLLQNPSGALLLDSINGATEFIKRIVNALLCNLTGIVTPQAILTALTDVLAPLLANPFLTGLRDFATAMGKTVVGLADGAVSGATELVRVLTNLLTCGLSTTDLTKITTFITEKFSAGVFNPAALLSQLKGLIDTITGNAWVTMVKNLATTLGLGGANFIEQLLNGFGGAANWILKALKTYLPFIPWTTIFPFLPWTTIDATPLPTIGGANLQTLLNAFNPRNILLAAGDFVTNLTNFFGFDATAFASGTFSAFTMAITFLDNIKDALLQWVNYFVLGGHDNILQWAQSNVTAPIVGNLLKGLNIDPAKFGIKTNSDIATVGLGVLGDIAGTLLTKYSQIPASLVQGILPPSVIGSIPVSSISDTSPNLITLGTFAENVNIDPADGWNWDAAQNAPQSSGGAAKLTISSAKNRYLYSRQTVPVGIGDRLVVNASVKTNAIAVSPAGSTPISIAIIPFVGSDEQETILIGTTAQNYSNWTTIGNTSTTPYTVTNPAWTSVVVRLGVDARATSGVIWWDDISLKKIGGLIQGNVVNLPDAWQKIYDTTFPEAGGTVDWTSLGSSILQLKTYGTTGVANASTADGKAVLADGKAQDTVDNIYQGITGTGGINNLPSTLKDAVGGVSDVASGYAQSGANLLPDPRINSTRLWKQSGMAVSTLLSNTTYSSTTSQSLQLTGNGSERLFYWPTNSFGSPYAIGSWPDKIYYVECYISVGSFPTITFTGSPTGGTFTLLRNGTTTTAITFSTTAATTATNIQTALGGSAVATVTASGAYSYTVTPVNTATTIARNTSSLTGGTTPDFGVSPTTVVQNPNTTATVKMFAQGTIQPFSFGTDISPMVTGSGFTAAGTWSNVTLTNPAGGTWNRLYGYFKVPALRNGFTAGISFTAASTHKVYVDDLVITEVTEAVNTNVKLYGRPTPADAIVVGSIPTGIPAANVAGLTGVGSISETVTSLDGTVNAATTGLVAKTTGLESTVGSGTTGLVGKTQDTIDSVVQGILGNTTTGYSISDVKTRLGGISGLGRGRGSAGSNLLADPKISYSAFWSGTVQPGLAVNTNTAFSRSTSQSLALTHGGTTERFVDFTVNDLGNVDPIITTPSTVYYCEAWVYSPTTNAVATGGITLHGKAVNYATRTGTTRDFTSSVPLVADAATSKVSTTFTVSPDLEGVWVRLYGYFTIPSSGYDGFKVGITLPANAASNNNIFYIDDLLVIDVTLRQDIPQGKVTGLTTLSDSVNGTLQNSVLTGGLLGTGGSIPTLETKTKGTVDNIYQAFTGLTTENVAPSLLKTWFQYLNNNLWGSNTMYATTAAGAVIKDDATPVVNNFVRGYRGGVGTGFTSAQVSETSTAIAKAAADLASQVSSLTTSSGGAAFSGTAISRDFSQYGTLTAAGFTVTSPSGSGGSLSIINGSAAWSGLASNQTIRAIHATPTSTNYQRVGIVFSGYDTGKSYIYARANSSGSNYVFASFQNKTITIGYNSGAGEGTVTGWSINTTYNAYWPGYVYWLEVGVGAVANQYRILSGNTPILTVTDPGYATGGGNYVGFGGLATYSNAARSEGGYAAPVSSFAFLDNKPPATVGSGFLVTKTTTTGVNFPKSEAGAIWPTGVFGAALKISDGYTWDGGTANALTVNRTGWFQVNVGARQASIASSGFWLMVGVRKNGEIVGLGGDCSQGGFSAAGSFTVYCEAGDILYPVYAQNYQLGVSTTGISIVGEATGSRTYFSVSFLNNAVPVESAN